MICPNRWKIKLCECGSQPELVDEGGTIDIVICRGCGAEGPPFMDGDLWAIEAWNKGKRNTGWTKKQRSSD